jgi:hypothetical protein
MAGERKDMPKLGVRLWRSTWRCVLCLGVVWLIGQEVLACMPWYFARQMSRDYPRLSILPRPLPDTTVAAMSRIEVKLFGCSFQMPWAEADKVTEGKSVTLMSFKSGGSLMFFDPVTQTDNIRIMRDAGVKRGVDIERVLGPDIFGSNYDLIAAAIRMTPQQVRLLASRRENARNMALLAVKLSDSPTNSNALYEVQQGEVRGFQMGDPAVAPFDVRLELFDKSDRHYSLWLNTSKGAISPSITQAQINAIVRSFHGPRETEASPSSAPTVAALH